MLFNGAARRYKLIIEAEGEDEEMTTKEIIKVINNPKG